MRIIGNIDHPEMKITVFKMDLKLSVKFETGFLEQTFKFNAGERLENLADVQKMITPDFIQEVNKRFKQMHLSTYKLTANYFNNEEEAFEEII